jgi:hypothetical protein
VEEDGLALEDVPPWVISRPLHHVRPSRLAAARIFANCYDKSSFPRQWRDLDAALIEAAPRLRPGLRLRIEDFKPAEEYVEEAAALCSTATPRRSSTSR